MITQHLEQYDVNLGVLHSTDKNRNQVSDVRRENLLADLMFGQRQPELTSLQ